MLYRLIAIIADDNGPLYVVRQVDRELVTRSAEPANYQIGDWVEGLVDPDGALTLIASVHAQASRSWSDVGDASRLADRNARGKSRYQLLRERNCIVREIRGYFWSEEFLEVETPLLVAGTCPDTAIESFQVADKYLTTSTEYQLKRLFVSGCPRLVTITKNFRNEPADRLHNPEFSMVEWARSGASLHDIEVDAEAFITRAFGQVWPGQRTLRFANCDVQLLGVPWERLTVRDALAKYLGINISPDFAEDELRRSAKASATDIPTEFLDDPMLIMSYLIDAMQPNLGRQVPTFLRDWPAFMTTSAALQDGVGIVAERTELFIAGVEIGDGFPFLVDATKQLSAFERANAARLSSRQRPVDLDQKFLAAVNVGLPPGAGMAIGLDRLVMVLTGADHIQEVMPFSWDEL